MGSEAFRTIKLTVAYDGTAYHGWQRQKDDRSLQGLIEDRLAVLTQEPVTVFASGRTDAGVHALGQICHFRTRSGIPLEGLQHGLNALLPDDVRIRRAESAAADFHARYSAKTKCYLYQILNRPAPDVFLRRYVWHLAQPLDRRAMGKALLCLPGTHDFSAFQSAGSATRSPVRTLSRAELLEEPAGVLRFTFTANGFLRHMVRNLVGTLVAVGAGRLSPEDFRLILEGRDRRRAGIKAPARGLFLLAVYY